MLVLCWERKYRERCHNSGIISFLIESYSQQETCLPVKAVDKMQMDPDYCLRRLTETVYAHVYSLVVVLVSTDG